MIEALTIIEKGELTQLEATIEKHLSAFYEVGFALMQKQGIKFETEDESRAWLIKNFTSLLPNELKGKY